MSYDNVCRLNQSFKKVARRRCIVYLNRRYMLTNQFPLHCGYIIVVCLIILHFILYIQFKFTIESYLRLKCTSLLGMPVWVSSSLVGAFVSQTNRHRAIGPLLEAAYLFCGKQSIFSIVNLSCRSHS